LHLVINCRPDRMERNGQMGALVEDIQPERVVLIGTPTRSARVTIPQKWHDTIVDLGGTRDAAELVDEIVDGIDEEASLIAIGNIHGQGELLLEQLATLPAGPAGALPEPARPATPPRPAAPARPGKAAPSRPAEAVPERQKPTPYPRSRPVSSGRVLPPAGAHVTQPLPRIRPGQEQ
jgi:hypothetical protein